MIGKIGITQKMALIFLIFFLIFSGTVVVLLDNVRQMVSVSERLGTTSKQLAELSEAMHVDLLDMDAAAKKFLLLKRPRYLEHFAETRAGFEDHLHLALQLSRNSEGVVNPWRQLAASYQKEFIEKYPTGESAPFAWVDESTLSEWGRLIDQAKRANQQEIERALAAMNEAGRTSGRYGLYGFVLSLVLCCLGIWYVSRAILSPLKILTGRLRHLSFDTAQEPIKLKGGSEFTELANAYNGMSRQLQEEESIRSEFIATLSHEIRTPLSSIHESVSMIAEEVLGPVNDKQRRFLDIAAVEIERIKNLLHHLLNVSVLESGPPQQEPRQLDTGQLIGDCAKAFAAAAERKKLRLLTADFSSCPQLFGVREEIEQVFINIIGNGVKFSPEGGTVSISWQPDSRRGYLLFRVADSGPGIPEEEQALIFTKYYRTRDTRSHLDGVGLGLAISRRIVAGYGGIITVANNTLQGCTFSFTLPVEPLSPSQAG
jgi:signal transduction histidine kinase